MYNINLNFITVHIDTNGNSF